PIAVHDGRAAGAVVVAVLVLVVGVVLVLPEQLAGLSIQGVEPGLVRKAVKLKQPPTADSGRVVADAKRARPDELETRLFGREGPPLGADPFFGGFAVAGGAEERRPIDP